MKTLKILIAALIFVVASCSDKTGTNNFYPRKTYKTYPVSRKTTKTEPVNTHKQEVATEQKTETGKKTLKNNNEANLAIEQKEVTADMIIETMEMDDVEGIIAPEEPVFYSDDFHTDEYDYLPENDYMAVADNPLSTFSIDVDNASYTEIRRYLNSGQLPPKDAVRIEEMINYFDYSYKNPTGEHPFSVYTEVATAPWKPQHYLMMIGIKGKELDYDNIKPGNLVFLIDTSGSMDSRDKLGLVKRSFKILLDNLPRNSTVSIVTYAGSAGLTLPPTPVKEKEKILKALEKLEAGGSTAGGEGIELAYKIAEENFIENGNNRVILATDGDFNVGVSSTGDLVRLIQKERDKGVFLTILGYGMGNYKDGRMEQISNAGNGNYFYIDNYSEAKKVFEKDLLPNMFTIAKDVKIQVEFNPNHVKAYRLIGYVNRKMENKDFNDDKKDAGELGAGHTVTALYEIIPAGSEENVSQTDELRYQKRQITGNSTELAYLKLRYKPIRSNKSILLSYSIYNRHIDWQKASEDFQFAAGVAGFGLLLRDSKYKGKAHPGLIKKLVTAGDSYHDKYKNELVTLIDKYEELQGKLSEND